MVVAKWTTGLRNLQNRKIGAKSISFEGLYNELI